MGISSEKAQNSQANGLLGDASSAVTKASEVNPDTKEMEDYWKSIVDWDTGKAGPVDIRKLPGSQVDIGLFEAAKHNHDAGRVGRGAGTMGDNVNSDFLTSFDKELSNERAMQASGDLENIIQGKVNDARTNLTGIGANRTQQDLSVAGMRQNLYSTYLNRPRDPGLLGQIVSGASAVTGAAGQAGGFAKLFAM